VLNNSCHGAILEVYCDMLLASIMNEILRMNVCGCIDVYSYLVLGAGADQWPEEEAVSPLSIHAQTMSMCAGDAADSHVSAMSALQWAECHCAKSFPFQDEIVSSRREYEVRDEVRDEVRGEVRSKVRDEVRDEVRGEVRDEIVSLRGSISSIRPILAYNIIHTYNATSACHLKSTGEMLAGYLVRQLWPLGKRFLRECLSTLSTDQMFQKQNEHTVY
jgi:hypothetical protein